MVHCVISLVNSDQRVHYAGELLKGTIVLHVNKPKKLRGLYLLVRGIARCMFAGTGQQEPEQDILSKHFFFKGKEVYLNQTTYMFGSAEANATEFLPGTYRYDYDFLLPPQLPGSFESRRGSIRYQVEAFLDIPWSLGKESKLQFTVARHDDLNLYLELKNPCKSEENKQFCNIFCQSGSLSMTVALPCSGFVPGQKIPVTVSYLNSSNQNVNFTRIWLKRVTRYNASTPRKKSKFETVGMVEVRSDGVAKGQRKMIVENLEIPIEALKSNSRLSKIIQIYYELKVEAEISGCHRNLKLTLPIEVGSIALNFNQYQEQTSSFTQDTFNPIAPQLEFSVSSEELFNPINLADAQLPPTFEEAIKMSSHLQEFHISSTQPNSSLSISAPSASSSKD